MLFKYLSNPIELVSQTGPELGKRVVVQGLYVQIASTDNSKPHTQNSINRDEFG